MFERFTDRSRRVLVLAQEEALRLDHDFLGTEHILLGLILEQEGVAARALESAHIRLEPVRERVGEATGPAGPATGAPPFTPRAKKVLELALGEALQLGHSYIGTEHLLLGLLREGEGVAIHVLVGLGADLSQLRREVMLRVGAHEAGDDDPLGGEESGLWLPSGPRCPGCRALLEGQVAYRVLTVPPDPADPLGPLAVAFVYCLRCGVTIAHTPAGPGDPVAVSSSSVSWVSARQTTHPRPQDTTREFPAELWDAPPPTVPPSAVVEVVHSGRFGADGSLRGTVAGSTVDLALELPRSASSATGRLGDLPIGVAWSLSYGSDSDSGVSATLQGSVGGQGVDLRGSFRHDPNYWFDRAWVEGTLAGSDLAVSVERASGGYGSSNTVAATGTLDERAFEIFAALGGSLEHGRIRGSFEGRSVHLELTARHGGDARVTGSCAAPAPLALLLVAALCFFV